MHCRKISKTIDVDNVRYILKAFPGAPYGRNKYCLWIFPQLQFEHSQEAILGYLLLSENHAPLSTKGIPLLPKKPTSAVIGVHTVDTSSDEYATLDRVYSVRTVVCRCLPDFKTPHIEGEDADRPSDLLNS